MHFAMIHGGMHGAWCWDLLKPELKMLGHSMTAIDLPCEDVMLGAAPQARLAVDFFVGLPDDMILVSHSIGALVGALVPTMRPVGAAVFLCSPLPDVGRSLLQQIAQDDVSSVDTLGTAQVDALGRTSYSFEVARRLLFSDCSDAVARWAFGKLRPQSTLVMTEITPLLDWPPIPYHYIAASSDRQLSREWAMKAVPRRLGTAPVELPGDHSPFLSRPRLLAEALSAIVGGAKKD